MKFPKRYTLLTREGYYFLIVLAFVLVRGLMKEINLMLALAGMMVGVFYFNWLGARLILRRVAGRRILPSLAVAGEPTTIEIEITSPHRATAIQCEDEFHLVGSSDRVDAGHGTVVFPQVPARQPTTAQYRVLFGRRGVYRFDRLVLVSRFPFRLVSRCRTLRDTRGELIVLPRLGRLTPRWSQFRRGMEMGDRLLPRQQGMTDGDFYGLRDWRPGDSRRWIHWRTSARRGALMVRQFEEPRSDDLTVLVDLWRPETMTVEQEENVELAVSLAATIVTDVCRQATCQLSLAVAGAKPIELSGPASRALGHEILNRLASAEATTADRWAALAAAGAKGRVVIVSTRPESDDERHALAAAPQRYSRAAPATPLRIDTCGAELAEYFQVD